MKKDANKKDEIMKTKAQKAVKILEQYAEECKTLPRGTSDLSPLEQWLLVKLIDPTNELSEDDADFIWSLMPTWIISQPKGLDPTMYGTLSMDGDIKICDRVKQILFKTGYHHKQRLTLDEYLKLLFPKKNE